MLLDWIRDDGGCGCRPTFEGDRLVLDASDCDGGGRLATEPACRSTAVGALTDRDARIVVSRAAGLERVYEDDAAAVLVAAGRFADAVDVYDESLATRVRTDPLRAAHDASARSGPVARLAAETGLAAGAERVRGYEDALRPAVGPTLGHSRVVVGPPADARIESRTDLDTGATVRWYTVPGEELSRYHVEPVERGLDHSQHETLATAAELLASGAVGGGDRAPRRAVVRVATPDDPIERLVSVLRKHTRGFGVLEDLFADPNCTDVFVTAPATRTPLRARIDGTMVRTNVRLTERGVETLASRFRRTSGRAFSRATPTLDALATLDDRRIRVAGVTQPVSDGVAFALRAHDQDAWTLPGLVENGTVTASAGALVSLAVERGANCLFVGARGAGKTTALGACCFELPAATRAVVIEDTRELPTDELARAGRDVQSLHVDRDGETSLTPTGALRTALRLGEGALVVGEVRGEEASTLFEAMRVGTTDGAVMGTVHGEGGAAVRERVVDDLGVSPGAFGAVDLVVTLAETPSGRRVTRIEEVVPGGDSDTVTDADTRAPAGSVPGFAPLFLTDDGLTSTDRLERGDSRLLETLSVPSETYAETRTVLSDRAEWLSMLSRRGVTDAEAVVEAHADRRVAAQCS